MKEKTEVQILRSGAASLGLHCLKSAFVYAETRNLGIQRLGRNSQF
jgi:hypothetical protein